MGEGEPGHNPEQEKLEDDDIYYYDIVADDSRAIDAALREVWSEPRGLAKAQERLALWHSVMLDSFLTTRTGEINKPPIAYPSLVDLAVHYEIYAGTLLLHKILPMSPDERAVLTDSELDYEDKGYVESGLLDRLPDLDDRWHRWLWPGGVRPQESSPRSDSALFAEACHRLAPAAFAISRSDVVMAFRKEWGLLGPE